MELLNNWNRITKGVTEWEMQEQVDAFLREYKFQHWNGEWYTELPKIVLREFRVPEVNRISDHVVLLNKRRVVNFECKLDDIGVVIKQAKDHLRWCDYSIIVIPPDRRYIANSYKLDCIRSGIGLYYWFKDIGMFEFMLPDFNRKKDMELRGKIIKRIIEKAQRKK